MDVLYVGPQEAGSPEPHRYEELDPDLQRKLETVCSRASNFGWEVGAALVFSATAADMFDPFVCVQAEASRLPAAVGPTDSLLEKAPQQPPKGVG